MSFYFAFSGQQPVPLRTELQDALEALCRSKDQNGSDHFDPPPQFDSWSQSLNRQSQNVQGSTSSLLQIRPATINDRSDIADFSVFQAFQHFAQISKGVTPTYSMSSISTFFDDHPEGPFDLLPKVGSSLHSQYLPFIAQVSYLINKINQSTPTLDMIWPNWPPNLPTPGLLLHLCVFEKACSSSSIASVCLTLQCRSVFYVPTTRPSPLPCSQLHSVTITPSVESTFSHRTCPPCHLFCQPNVYCCSIITTPTQLHKRSPR